MYLIQDQQQKYKFIPYFIRFPDIDKDGTICLSVGSIVNVSCNCGKTHQSIVEFVKKQSSDSFGYHVTYYRVKKLTEKCTHWSNEYFSDKISSLTTKQKLEHLQYKFYPLVRRIREHLKWKPDSKFLKETNFFEEKQMQLNLLNN
jgi:hypothetical protein